MIEGLILDIVNAGGKKVSEEEYKRRLEICRGCDLAGIVKPIPKVGQEQMEFEGCTECECPFETKLKFKYHFLNGFKLITCPHPEGQKW